jgi:hypothetical protein
MKVQTKKVVKKEVKEVKVAKNRDILGIKLSKKLPNEVVATIEVIKTFKGKVNVPYNTLYSEFLVELAKISKSKSNLRTRFDRILYRNLEGILLKNSIQSAKFNLKANIKGILIKPKNTIEFKTNGDAILSTVRENLYSFKVLKKISTIEKSEITTELLAKINELKA